MKKVVLKHKNILGIEMKYEAFYLGTVNNKGEVLHLISERDNNLDSTIAYTLTEEEFKEFAFVEPTHRSI
jgi:hypothetical protein